MDLAPWGFDALHLLEGEEVVLAMGRRHGVSDSAFHDGDVLLLTTRRVLHMGRGGRGRRILVAPLESVESLEQGTTGRPTSTMAIGILGVVGGLLGWLFLPPSPSFLPPVAGAVALTGALLLLLLVVLPEQGFLALRMASGEVRLELSSPEARRQAPAFVDRFFAIREVISARGDAETPRPRGAASEDDPRGEKVAHGGGAEEENGGLSRAMEATAGSQDPDGPPADPGWGQARDG